MTRFANRGAYTALLSQLTPVSGSSDDPNVPLNISIQAASLKCSSGIGLTPPPKFDKSDFPKVCLWTEREYKIWKKTPEGIAKKLTAFVEDKDGKQLDNNWVGKINSMMYEVWLDLCNEGHINAEMTWTSMPLTVQKTFHWELANTFVELNYCEDLWKVDAHAKAIYPSWKQMRFTKKSGKCMKVKEDADEDLDKTTHDSAAAGPEGDSVEESPVDAAATPFSFTGSPLESLLSHSTSEASATSSSVSGPIPHNTPVHKGDENTGVWLYTVP